MYLMLLAKFFFGVCHSACYDSGKAERSHAELDNYGRVELKEKASFLTGVKVTSDKEQNSCTFILRHLPQGGLYYG